jgi:hypothetical protein
MIHGQQNIKLNKYSLYFYKPVVILVPSFGFVGVVLAWQQSPREVDNPKTMSMPNINKASCFSKLTFLKAIQCY